MCRTKRFFRISSKKVQLCCKIFPLEHIYCFPKFKGHLFRPLKPWFHPFSLQWSCRAWSVWGDRMMLKVRFLALKAEKIFLGVTFFIFGGLFWPLFINWGLLSFSKNCRSHLGILILFYPCCLFISDYFRAGGPEVKKNFQTAFSAFSRPFFPFFFR